MRGLERAGQITTAMLRELERYEIPHKPLLLAQADHVHWLQQLVQMLAGHSDLKPEEVTPHDRCRFDRWYLREGAGHQSHRDEYYALAGPHERFHEQARLVVECHRAGKADQAKRAFAELVDVTRELLGRLDELYQAMSTANPPSPARRA